MQAESGSRQTGVGIPATDGVAVCFAIRVAKSTVGWLIVCVVLGFWISSERFLLSNAMLASSGNGILESAGVALFVSGLSPYLPQGSPQQPDNYAGLQGPHEFQRAGERQQFPLRLEFLAWLFLCGFVSWGGTVWMVRR